MYVIIVPVEIEPGRKEEFLRLLEPNARGAVLKEPGCLRFDVIQDGQEPNRVWFYEVYADEAALKSLQQSPHFLAWKPHFQKLARVELQGAGAGAHNVYPSDEDW